ncbi:uncharacterized protein [Palaemon carinicauda]|uniref:uncharacterized protein n=1 Tax=Palaemon carinicauda TaxID=392227 RepID=UPI0035B60038
MVFLHLRSTLEETPLRRTVASKGQLAEPVGPSGCLRRRTHSQLCLRGHIPVPVQPSRRPADLPSLFLSPIHHHPPRVAPLKRLAARQHSQACQRPQVQKRPPTLSHPHPPHQRFPAPQHSPTHQRILKPQRSPARQLVSTTLHTCALQRDSTHAQRRSPLRSRSTTGKCSPAHQSSPKRQRSPVHRHSPACQRSIAHQC